MFHLRLENNIPTSTFAIQPLYESLGYSVTQTQQDDVYGWNRRGRQEDIRC